MPTLNPSLTTKAMDENGIMLYGGRSTTLVSKDVLKKLAAKAAQTKAKSKTQTYKKAVSK